ncbi:ABC transporter ATP-binding protein [Lactobacillus agrestimuris]|uniref:ABC transporter ATP-binding protein n=1 Tax=Lactobacillus agrestimuris TaxID=2941328 RepID=UPI002043D8C1|nr:ABC transporter ATP-binding protein [Lactobacillus agrestimuris]
MEPIIQFKNFSFQYDSQAEPTLRNINFSINPGEKILLAGPSGSGKSTIGRCLNGLIPNVDHGDIQGACLVDGKDITETSLFDLSFTTSTILQDSDSQFIGMTVGEDIAFSLENDCQDREKMHKTVNKWANELELTALLKQTPQTLSGGQKQLVALAGVLVDESPILLFDEPLANLDPAAGYKTIELIDKIQKEVNATVIIIEHRIEEVLAKHVDRIILVNDGEIIADQEPNDLLHTDKLEKVGVRSPLYVKALEKAGINLLEVPDLTSVKELPKSSTIKEKLEIWKSKQTEPDELDHKKALLKLENVGHQYNKHQQNPLHGVNLTVNQGDFISIVGQNGAGKTTLCRTICGFISNEGKISLNNQNLADLSIKERAEHIGYVMQDPNQMISQKMIFDEVALGLRLRNVDEDTIKEKVYQTLKICGLYPFRNWPISALSFGQKKRVTIAAILALEPEIIILDEPTAGQDWKTYTEIMDFLRELNERGTTIMIVTHDMHLMLEYSKRSLAFAKGELIADTTPIDLLTDKNLVAKASLRRTSLYDLAVHYDLDNPNDFVKAYIDSEEQVVK